MSVVIAMIKGMRPKQWAKNVFLFAAIVFAKEYTNVDSWVKVIMAFTAFCCVSSSGYLLNDIRDVEADKKHPRKRKRAIASGALPIRTAYIQMVFLFVFGLFLAYLTNFSTLAVVLLYFINTISYSLLFKNFVILDVMLIATGFLWRVAAGALAIDVPISPWLLMCTGFLALFFGFNKRRGELLNVKEKGTRANISQYNVQMVQEFQAITTSGTIITYSLYCVFINQWLLMTLPCVLYGLFRYIYLVTAQAEGDAPDETLLKDKPMLVTGLLYCLIAVSVLVMFPESGGIVAS